MPEAMRFEKTKEPDYNPKDVIVFQRNPLIGLMIARFPKSVLSLYWTDPAFGGGGYVYIGRPLLPTNAGGYITRVTNYHYEYAENQKAFMALAKRFNEESMSND